MTLALITAKQVIVLFILIFSGFICVKTGAVKIEGRKAFSDLLVYFVVPCMIINSYLTEFDDNIFKNILYALGLSILLLVVGFAITFLLSFKLKGDNVPIVRFGCMFSNAAYMGFPLIQALFGSEGLIYASAFVTTPAIISVFIGLLIFIAGIPLPDIISQPISYAAAINTPLSMFITGMIIAASPIKNMFNNKLVYFAIIVRMFIIPVVCIAIFKIFNISGMVADVVIILEACPCASISSVFAVQFGYDEDVAAAMVVLTTFISIITLPAVALIITTLI